MEVSLVWAIIIVVVGLIVQYIIIETAVKRGVDCSETNQLLKEIKDLLGQKNTKK